MDTTTDKENRLSKLEFIKAFFKDLESKIAFLDELHNSGRREEEIVSYIHPKMLENAFSKKHGKVWENIKVKDLSLRTDNPLHLTPNRGV